MVSAAVTIGFVTSLAAFGISCGILFCTLLVRSQGGGTNRRLIAFCLALIGWSLILLLASLGGQSLPDQPYIVWQLLATALTFSVFAYLVIVIPYFRPGDRLVQAAVVIAPVLVLISLVLIWSGALFLAGPVLDTGGVTMLAVALVYGVLTFWGLLTSPHKDAPSLRLPTGLIVLALGSEMILTLRATGLGLLLMTIAGGWIAVVKLRSQLGKPVRDLRDELRVANQDLRQVVADLATERGRSADLTKQLSDSRDYGQAKLDFLDRLGHRLRTLLNSISGYTELLVTGVYGELSEKQHDRMAVIHRNSVVLLALIRDMLDFNVLDAGHMTLQLRSMSLYGLVQQALTRITVLNGGEPTTIETIVPSTIHPIMADEERFPQLLAHVMYFALKSGSAPVRVSVQNVQVKSGIGQHFTLPLIGWLADGEWVITQVSSPELILSPDEQTALFEPFSDSDDQTIHVHTGLGLTIARKLIELHQGAIWVKSQPEQGTSFYIAVRAVIL